VLVKPKDSWTVSSPSSQIESSLVYLSAYLIYLCATGVYLLGCKIFDLFCESHRRLRVSVRRVVVVHWYLLHPSHLKGPLLQPSAPLGRTNILSAPPAPAIERKAWECTHVNFLLIPDTQALTFPERERDAHTNTVTQARWHTHNPTQIELTRICMRNAAGHHNTPFKFMFS
jgi:hypothetical protein